MDRLGGNSPPEQVSQRPLAVWTLPDGSKWPLLSQTADDLVQKLVDIQQISAETAAKHGIHLKHFITKLENRWMSGSAQGPAHLSAQDFRSLIGTLELVFPFNAFNRLIEMFVISGEDLIVIQNLITLRILAERGKYEGFGSKFDLDSFERKTIDRLSLRDLEMLLKVGKDGGPDFEPIVSKLLYVLGYGPKAVYGRVSPGDIDQYGDSIAGKFRELTNGDKHQADLSSHYVTRGNEIEQLYHRFLSRGEHLITLKTAAELFDILQECPVNTFYTACEIAAHFVDYEINDNKKHFIGFEGKAFSQELFKNLFGSFEDLMNPVRRSVIRNIQQQLPDDHTKEEFVKRFCRFLVLHTHHRDLKVLNDILQGGTFFSGPVNYDVAGEKERYILTPSDGGRPEYPDRSKDIPRLIEHIIQNRSSHISHDGHKIPFDDHESLAVGAHKLIEARIKKNKETGRSPDGLACNVTFHAQTNALHSKIKPDGSFAMRFLDKNGKDVFELDRRTLEVWVQNTKSMFMATVTNPKKALLRMILGETNFLYKPDGSFSVVVFDNKDNVVVEINSEDILNGTFMAFFDELHYLALEKLKVVYCRKKVEVADEVVQSSTPVPPPPDSGEITLEPGIPVTPEREDKGTMAIDLTDREKKIRSKNERADRIRIESNRAKVLEVFGRIGLGEDLSEVPPEMVRELLLHTCTKINGDLYFEASSDPVRIYESLRQGKLKPEDVFIRISRAFTQPLPYMNMMRRTANDPNGNPYYVVRQKHRRNGESDFRKELFVSSEGGETLETNYQEKILYFDVEDKGENSPHHVLFERIKSGKDIPSILRSVDRGIKHALDEYRRIARKKYLEDPGKTPDPMRYSQVMKRLERRAHRVYDHTDEILQEISEKAIQVTEQVITGEGVRNRTKLRLPAAFRFEETFNQGRFQSLQDLLDSGRKPKKSKKNGLTETAPR